MARRDRRVGRHESSQNHRGCDATKVEFLDGWVSKLVADAPAASWVEHFAYWLLRPRREVAILLIAIGIAVAWGLTHPPATDLTPRDAYVLSISPFDPNHDSGR